MEKHVQAALPEAVYARLRRRAKEEQRPLKAVVRAAIEEYLGAHERPDPLHGFIGSLALGGDRSGRKDWRDPSSKRRRPGDADKAGFERVG